MSYIASLCIRKPASHNVLSYKKRKRIEANEVLVADVSKSAAKGNRSASRLSREMKGRFPPTRFERMAALKRRHSPREVSIARVDVQGGFTCSHGRFRISPDAGQYLPQQTEQGLFYPMDQVVIMDCGSKL